MEEAPIGAVASCQVCGAPLTTPKKYQIHKNDQGFSLGGKPYVLHPLPDDVEGHACHKCYQANMKAKVRDKIEKEGPEGRGSAESDETWPSGSAKQGK